MITYFALVEGRDNSDFFGVIAIDGRLPKERAKGLIEQCEYGISEMSDFLIPVSDFSGFSESPLRTVEMIRVEEKNSTEFSGMILARESGQQFPCLVSRDKNLLGDFIYQMILLEKRGGRECAQTLLIASTA